MFLCFLFSLVAVTHSLVMASNLQIDEIVVGMARGRAERIVEPDRRRAIRRAVRSAEPGDVVLIAGKGHETAQQVGSTAHQFDDRVVALEEMA